MKRLRKKRRKRIFLACFNILKENENIRDKSSLWGHYAQSCTGVCLKINKVKFDELLFDVIYDNENDAIETNTHIAKFKVEYKKESEIYKHREICSKGTRLPFYIELKYLFGRKSSEWNIENEFRYLVYNANFEEKEYFYIDKFSSSIEAIYVGRNNKDISLLKDLKIKIDSNIKFYKIDKERKEIEI